MENKVEMYVKKFESLVSDASQRDDWINRIAKYATPTLYNYQYNFTNTKDNLPADVYDSEMVQAATEFSNLFFTYLTNPATRWFALTLFDPKIINMSGVKDYLEDLEKVVYGVLYSSNFYVSIQQSFLSLVSGNAVVYRETDPIDIIRYYSLPLSECYFEYDSKNRVNAMYRRIKKTPLQLIEEFPDTVSDKVRDQAKQNQNTTLITVYHIVRPRWQRDITKIDKLNKAYESIYIDKDNSTILKEDGYDKFPFFVGHYMHDPHSPYSYGPAHLCFYDVKSLNQLVLSYLRRKAKEADPVLSLPHDGYILPFLQDNGAINYRTTNDPKDKAEYLIPPPASVEDTIQDFRQKIKRAFFVDLYRSIVDSTKRMTAYEVQQHLADRAPMLGPAIWNLTTDFINHIIFDLVDYLISTGQAPAPPQVLFGKGYRIEYLSQLAKSQKINEFNSINSFLTTLGGILQINQDVVDNIEFDVLTRIAADTVGIPQSVIVEEGDVQQKRKTRYEALARVQQKQELMQGATAMKDASQADKNLSEAQGAA